MIKHPAIKAQGQIGFGSPEIHEGLVADDFTFQLDLRDEGATLEVVGHGMRGWASLSIQHPGNVVGIFKHDDARASAFAVLLPIAMASLATLP